MNPDFHTAVQLARQGERNQAYRLLCRVLRETPSYVPAWLWMSGLVSDVSRQLECLERALRLDPSCAAARAGLEHLRRHMRPTPTDVVDRGEAWAIGRYLVHYRLISELQLREALAEQQARSRIGQRARVGELLLQRGAVTPHGLATMLMMQAQEQLFGAHARPPSSTGEYLLAHGYLTVEQLATVLAEQMELQRRGVQVPIGTLLRRSEYISPQVLERALMWHRQGHNKLAA